MLPRFAREERKMARISVLRMEKPLTGKALGMGQDYVKSFKTRDT